MAELLRIEDLSAGYGQGVVLSDLSLTLTEGEAMAVLGRNGMGKTTLVATLMGTTVLHQGRIWFRGNEITRVASHRRAEFGLGWVPQERDIFPSLTVEENLTAVARQGHWTPDLVFTLFPRLTHVRDHFGYQLSGGEQQMLAIGRALVLNPALLLLDEPLEGLAPIVVQELLAAIEEMVRSSGLAILIVEQHARQILPLTRSTIILERGRIVHQGPSADLEDDPAKLEKWLALADR